ncbi:MAG: NAD(P)H-dependent oxidoreductase [Hyphomicrobium sp.]|nr:NAD(P)H-dependent oxidoreductase [Hyphomicrobium sp.]
MSRILRIDTSSRTDGSYSRDLTNAFIARWLQRHPNDQVMVRDLVAAPIPHIADVTIKGYYTPADQMDVPLKAATALSDLLIHELRSADVLVLSVPMYNFSIPSALKAWIDQIVRIGHTFSYDGKGFTGMLPGKRAYVMIAYGAGGYLDGGPFGGADFVQPYLKFLLNFLGIADVTFINVEATTADPATISANVTKARALIDAAVAAAPARAAA